MGWLPGMGVEADTKKYSRNNEIESLHEFQFFGSTNVLNSILTTESHGV